MLLATSPDYEARVQSYWSWEQRKRPLCFIQPHNAQEVSTVLTAVLGDNHGSGNGAGDWHMAIRAGGHGHGGSNNIEDGATLDLKYLNTTTYDPKTNTASVSPGSKWEWVYAELHKHGVIVTGGRDGDVGVGGFLLGGGSTYFMAKQGFGCDSIKNFEVVLTNGTIVNANKDQNSDLWRALKGGGSNFGVVTRYDMDALPDKKLFHGERTIQPKHATEWVDAVSDFTNNQKKYNEDALIGIVCRLHGLDLLVNLEINTEGKDDSPAFDEFSKIPKMADYKKQTAYLTDLATPGTALQVDGR